MKHSDPRKAAGQGAYSRGHIAFTHVTKGKANPTRADRFPKAPDRGGVGVYAASRVGFDRLRSQTQSPGSSSGVSGTFTLDRSKLDGSDVLG